MSFLCVLAWFILCATECCVESEHTGQTTCLYSSFYPSKFKIVFVVHFTKQNQTFRHAYWYPIKMNIRSVGMAEKVLFREELRDQKFGLRFLNGPTKWESKEGMERSWSHKGILISSSLLKKNVMNSGNHSGKCNLELANTARSNGSINQIRNFWNTYLN